MSKTAAKAQAAKKAPAKTAPPSSGLDAETAVGPGGEPHQVAAEGGRVLTTNHGMAISDNHNSLKAGPRGPTLLEDFILREKIFHFDHERIPERVVHARGLAAVPDEGVAALTKAADVGGYVDAAAKGRLWDREPRVRTVF